jgi:hypothetical protein
MLLTVGTEDASYKRSQVKSKTMIRTISTSTRFAFYKGAESRHILPSDLPTPKPLMHHMVPVAEPEPPPPGPKKRANRVSAKQAAAAASDALLAPLPLPPPPLAPSHPEPAPDDEVEFQQEPFEFEPSEFDDDESLASEIEFQLEDNEHTMQIASATTLINPHRDAAEAMEIDAPQTMVQPLPPTSTAPSPIPHVAPLYQTPITPAIPVKSEKPSSTATNFFETCTAPAPSILARSSSRSVLLDQSGDSLDAFGPQLKPLDDFPMGFFDSSSFASQQAGVYIPPPPEIPLPVDFELGLIPIPSTYLLESIDPNIPIMPSVLQVPSLVPRSAPKPSTLDSNTTKQSEPPSQMGRNSMIFHPLSSAPTPLSAQSNPSILASPAIDLLSHASLSKMTEKSPEKKVPPPASTNTSILLSPSVESSETNSPNFKRLKRGRHVEEEDLILMDDSDNEVSSPPVAKRFFRTPSNRLHKTSKPKSKFIDEEASLDEENSDEMNISTDERPDGPDSIPNSQDLAFIAAEGECDTSLTGMKAVYAQSLSSPAGKQKSHRTLARGLQGLGWLNGDGLEHKMKEWAEYSDVEEASFSQSSASALGGSTTGSVRADMNISLYSIDSDPVEDLEEISSTPVNPVPNSIPSTSFLSSVAPIPVNHATSKGNFGGKLIPDDDDDDDVLADEFPLRSAKSSAATITRPKSIQSSMPSSSGATSLSQAPLRLGFQKHAFTTSVPPKTTGQPIQRSQIGALQSQSTVGAIPTTTSLGSRQISSTPSYPAPGSHTRINLVKDLIDGLDYEDFM